MLGFLLNALMPVILIAIAVVAAIQLFVFLGVTAGTLPELGSGSAPLTCPHCGAETSSDLLQCQSCGQSFRDESMVRRPILDAPKLTAVGSGNPEKGSG
ncbi:MAG: hypothetical protein ACKV0T_08370 [Planctomycetales bacterium]